MRHDHTAWLIHFVRDRDPEQDFPGETDQEYERWVGGELSADATAFEVLKTIVRLGGLIPGYSFRNGRTTIYGGGPAVCATEMPLYSFADYARSRSDSAKVSAYGVAFLKSEFYAAGGRPVIYGISEANPRFIKNTYVNRIFASDVLPLHEQYRYVAYNPSGTSNWVDWSHEREWRWIPSDPNMDEIWAQDSDGCYGPTPALPLFKGKLDGRPFTKLCLIVWSREEAREIRELLTGFYLAGGNNYDTPFDKELIKSSRIIVLEDVVDAVENGKKLESQTIEGLQSANLLKSISIVPPPADVKKTVKKAMAKATAAAKSAIEEFTKDYGLGSAYCGYAHAATNDVTSPIVQYLLSTEQASGPFDGIVWINYPEEHPFSQSMDYNETACEAAAEALTSELGIDVYVESRPD